jgi:hypothetical protein
MNFHFVWKAVDINTNEIEGIYEQTIYGETLAKAVEVWESFHGGVGIDDNGCEYTITEIKLTD